MTYRYPGGLVRRTAANTAITGASGVWDLGSQAQAVRNNTWPISGLANPVSGSLRFRASATAYLTRTGSTATNAKLATYSFWFKRGALTTGQWLFTGGTTVSLIGFNGSSDALSVLGSDTSGEGNITTAVFRDTSAWYHVVIAIDTSQATTADRAKIYVNGVLQAVTVSNGGIGSNSNWGFNTAGSLAIGRYNPVPGSYTDGYMAEVNFIDGLALTPASFGQTSAITGVWEPIKYTGTYGTNGFYLSLSDTSSIGKDFSGNGNNWTPNNISTANDSTFDLMRDVPTQYTPQGATDVGGVVRGNYCTLNPLDFTTVGTISEGNLKFTQGTSGAKSGRATFGVSSGKWYWEYTHLGGNSSPGIGNASMTLGYYCGGDANGWSYFVGGAKYNNDAGTSYGASYTTNDVIGIALDMDAGTLVFYKNGASQGTAFSSLTGTMFPAFSSSSVSNVTFIANFGQRPFAYTPPSGFKSLCTTNLPTPTIGATAATAANKYFDATLYTSTGTTQTVTNSGSMQPDFVWQKARSNIQDHYLFDSVRGSSKWLESNTTDVEGTSATFLTSFNSNGVTWGTGNLPNGWTNVIWQWNAGGSTVTNTSGSISSQVRANPTAGFSIVTYSGNGTGGATIGHGLGVAPSMMIFKPRNAVGSWLVWHTGYNSNQAQMLLDSTAAIYNPGNGLYFNSTYPSSTVATLGTSSSVNDATYTYVAYMFAPVAGYSAFGSYTGNDSADGAFIYTGFRPAFVLYKKSTGIDGWVIYDAKRNTYNVADALLQPNTGGAEASSAPGSIDMVSNGFKHRNANNIGNSSSFTYIYMAFAETPFKNSLAR